MLRSRRSRAWIISAPLASWPHVGLRGHPRAPCLTPASSTLLSYWLTLGQPAGRWAHTHTHMARSQPPRGHLVLASCRSRPRDPPTRSRATSVASVGMAWQPPAGGGGLHGGEPKPPPPEPAGALSRSRSAGPVWPLDDHGPDQHLPCSLARDTEPTPPRQVTRIPDPQKPCEIINVYCCFEPLWGS